MFAEMLAAVDIVNRWVGDRLANEAYEGVVHGLTGCGFGLYEKKHLLIFLFLDLKSDPLEVSLIKHKIGVY